MQARDRGGSSWSILSSLPAAAAFEMAPCCEVLLLVLLATSLGDRARATITGDVTLFGAVPDDGKDDTAAIQRALDSCAKNGGMAFVPTGTYTISLPARPAQRVIDTCLVLPSNCTLFGEGEASILKWDSSVNSQNWWRMLGVELAASAKGDGLIENVVVRDLAIDGSTTHTVYPCFNATTGAELCEHNTGMFFYVHPPHVGQPITCDLSPSPCHCHQYLEVAIGAARHLCR